MNALELMRSEVKYKALKTVNSFRLEAGLEPLKELPRGTPHNSDCCVIAKALDVRVLTISIQPNTDEMTRVFENHTKRVWDENTFHIPDELFDFIFIFDEGEYPELIERKD